MGYDTKCHDIAAAFLEDTPSINTPENVATIAQAVQDAIESHIDWLLLPPEERLSPEVEKRTGVRFHQGGGRSKYARYRQPPRT